MDLRGKCRYRCRRGLLELDVILTRFCETSLEDLTLDEQQVLLQLLEQPDPVLLQYVLGEIPCDDASLVPMLEKIAQFRLD